MSPNQLIPSQPYDLSYYITDHTDNNTYYVRAVVYDANTGEVLDTQNLVQQSNNSHLYLKRAQAPGDSSGHGRRIVVVATAYEDSGYTTKSSLYQEQSEVYLVVKPGAGLTLGGGYIDYNVIKEISQAVLKEFIADNFKTILKKIQVNKVLLDNLSTKLEKVSSDIGSLNAIIEALNELKSIVSLIPTDNTIDLTNVLNKIDSAIVAINEKDVTPETDLTALSNLLQEVKDIIDTNHLEIKDKVDGHISKLNENLPKIIKEGSKQSVVGSRFRFIVDAPEEDQPVKNSKKELDISKLLT